MKFIESSNRELVLLEYGDNFPVEYIHSKDDIPYTPDTKYYLYVYLSKYCGSCMDNFASIAKMYSIFQSDRFGIKILWQEDDAPLNFLKKYNISEEDCLYVDSHLKLSTSVPKYYIVDDEDRVVFVDNSVDDIVEKIFALEILDTDFIAEKGKSYILSQYSSQNDKPIVIYFTMDGCKDCEFADMVVDDIMSTNDIDLIKIYSYHTTDPERICDTDKIFLKTFGIDWYPSFLIITPTASTFLGRVDEHLLKDSIDNALQK